jgi:hypothetical protein
MYWTVFVFLVQACIYTSAVDSEAMGGIVAWFMARTKYERKSGGVF